MPEENELQLKKLRQHDDLLSPERVQLSKSAGARDTVHPGQAAGPAPELKPAPGSVLAEAMTHTLPRKGTPVGEAQRKRKFADVAAEVFLSMRKHTAFPHDAHEDAKENLQHDESSQTASTSYRLAFADNDFLLREDMRSTRLSLEYQKVETTLREAGITGTIVVFGSARLKPGTIYYEHARELGKLMATKGGQHGVHIITGGGPGIMQAANHGAYEAGSKTIGLNIVLPFEQHPNPYITPELCFSFHYFSIRKMHLLLRAKALVAFPGGYGTLDELFETLTLVQTKKMEPIPIVLYGTKFWKKIVNMEGLVEEGVISPEDLNLFKYADMPVEAVEIIAEFYRKKRATSPH